MDWPIVFVIMSLSMWGIVLVFLSDIRKELRDIKQAMVRQAELEQKKPEARL